MDTLKRIFFMLVGSGMIMVFINHHFLNRSKNKDPSVTKINDRINSHEEEIATEANSIWPKDSNETNDRIFNQLRFSHNLNESGKANITKVKVIYFLPYLGVDYKGPPDGQGLFISERCPIQACRLTRKLAEIKHADAVYIKNLNKSTLKDFLPKPQSQVWIVSFQEAPPSNARNHLIDTSVLDDLVNWTMTYRRDSTIPDPYGKFQLHPNFTRIEDYPVPDGINYAAGKTKKVAWFVSNCHYNMYSGRNNYANELSKFIDVDIYGDCGPKKCPKTQWGACFKMLQENYKFYLSFENSCCKGYITEKLFSNALRHDVIPIVLGASPEDYKAVAEPASYIHVDDFESPRELAKYLHRLDKNDKLYNEYFRWKKTGELIPASPWCRLCAMLHGNENRNYVHWYHDFQKWWQGEGICLGKVPSGKWHTWPRK